MVLNNETIYKVPVHKIMQAFNAINVEIYENSIDVVHVFNRGDLVGYWALDKQFKPKGVD